MTINQPLTNKIHKNTIATEFSSPAKVKTQYQIQNYYPTTQNNQSPIPKSYRKQASGQIVDAGEGVGMVVRQTSAQFIPGGHLAFAIVAEFDPMTKQWRDAINPR